MTAVIMRGGDSKPQVLSAAPKDVKTLVGAAQPVDADVREAEALAAEAAAVRPNEAPAGYDDPPPAMPAVY